MILFLLTTQEKVGKRIAKRLSEKYNYVVPVFTCPSKLFEAAFTEGVSRVDLIIMDYLAFGSDEVELFDNMRKMECVIPYICYNTPFAPSGARTEYWLDRIRRKVGDCISDAVLDNLATVFRQIETIIEEPDIFPYIRLLNEPPEIVDSDDDWYQKNVRVHFQTQYSLTKKQRADLAKQVQSNSADSKKSIGATVVEHFKNLKGVQKSRVKLLEYLCAHEGEIVSEEQICSDLWREFNPTRVNTLYSYICGIKKAVESDSNAGFAIDKPQKRCYRLTFSDSV